MGPVNVEGRSRKNLAEHGDGVIQVPSTAESVPVTIFRVWVALRADTEIDAAIVMRPAPSYIPRERGSDLLGMCPELEIRPQAKDLPFPEITGLSVGDEQFEPRGDVVKPSV
jgi:hypothetical protein